MKDMLRNQLFGKRDLPFPVDFWDKHGDLWAAPGDSMRLGKRPMADSMRLGKRDPWAGDDPWLQDYNSRLSQDYDEDYDIEKRAFDDSIRLGKRSR